MRTAHIILPTRCLFMWQLLTITRPAEAAEARWDEIDLEAREWKIPATRMKMNRDHTVPLSDEAIALLDMMKPLSGNREFIFPSRIKPTKPMNSQTVNASLKRAGFGGVIVSHDPRSIASTALNEQGFPPDVIEAAVAHVDKKEAHRAYNRSDYLEQRRPMMQWWVALVMVADRGGMRGVRLAG